jgi:AraC family transcriptional regulator
MVLEQPQCKHDHVAAPPGSVRGPLFTCGVFRLQEVEYVPDYRQPAHAHEEASVTLVLSGIVREQACSREEHGSALSVVVKPPGVRHTNEWGPNPTLTLQVAFAADVLSDVAATAPALEQWRWLHARPVAAAMLALLARMRREVSCALTGVCLEDRVFDVLAAVTDDAPLGGEPPAWLRRVREAVEDDPHATLPLTRLARDAGVHPVSLSRAFRRHFGCTLTEYRRRQRLRRAAAAIAADGEGLGRIAHAAGFADHPHLCREFRGVAGITPSGFRGLLASG